MIRNFKVLGLALVAVLAMSAVVASAASAQFTTNSAPTTVTATSALGNDVFTVDGSSVECAGHFEGTANETSVSSIEMTPTYTNCRAFGFAEAKVTVHGCRIVIIANGGADIICIGPNPFIVIEAGNCEVQISPQSNLKSIALSNSGSHINSDANVTGITANVTKDGFLCPFNGTGHKSATYTQGSAVTVKPVKGGTSISVD